MSTRRMPGVVRLGVSEQRRIALSQKLTERPGNSDNYAMRDESLFRITTESLRRFFPYLESKFAQVVEIKNYRSLYSTSSED